MIHYAYERATGLYAGSGTPHIDTATHSCTTVPAPEVDEDAGEAAVFDVVSQTWTVTGL